MARASRDEQANFLRTTPLDHLLFLSEQAVITLGTYSYLMAKRERVRGVLLEEQVIRVLVREQPFATRLEYDAGPSQGRIVVFNSAASADHFRVREGGLLSIAGPLWLHVDSPMARADSNHTIKEAGLGNLISRLRREVQKAAPLGGIQVTGEGWNEAGHSCQLYVMPAGGKGFDSAKTRVCIDLAAGIPTRVESYDANGALLERYVFSQLKPVQIAGAALDPAQPF